MSHPKEFYTTLVPCPSADSINSGLNSCPTNLLISKFGKPRERLSQDCMPVTNKTWKKYIVTMDVGPFRATGHRLFLETLKTALVELKTVDPILYSLLESAGCLCCRLVRGTHSTLSNHALGMAIDFTCNGVLDQRGDGRVLNGMLSLYSILKKYKIWWGAEFKTEDGMHFEASAELVHDWLNQGLLVA